MWPKASTTTLGRPVRLSLGPHRTPSPGVASFRPVLGPAQDILKTHGQPGLTAAAKLARLSDLQRPPDDRVV